MAKTRKQELDDANEQIKLLKAQLAQAQAIEKANKAKAASDSDMVAEGSTEKAPSEPRASRNLNPTKAKRNSKRSAPAGDRSNRSRG